MPPYRADKNLSPKLVQYNFKIKLKIKASFLNQDKVIFTPQNMINLFIVYELDTWSEDLNNDF